MLVVLIQINTTKSLYLGALILCEYFVALTLDLHKEPLCFYHHITYRMVTCFMRTYYDYIQFFVNGKSMWKNDCYQATLEVDDLLLWFASRFASLVFLHFTNLNCGGLMTFRAILILHLALQFLGIFQSFFNYMILYNQLYNYIWSIQILIIR